ncbi:formate dehydrogenase subunit delta [Ruixingdingia sedimenti]|uniref:Formate dehydrogenase subunit delta n=1 Tax=Ruixingdingia sedimenti TaxID=3073604 RepID=A0ABU1F477_9RHOB|nr:formate dehydrogenase subunit delta [Xinfangfangia sp. LG-4]MDR5651666.1 formate dehydrogenase subunit delta [Xinfangfangia sp. LG-4]
MPQDRLIRMANQIAGFFETQPRADAAAEVAKHINDFWDPRMRRALAAIIAGGGQGLNPLVLRAAPAIRVP